jgi:hypothetical protein
MFRPRWTALCILLVRFILVAIFSDCESHGAGVQPTETCGSGRYLSIVEWTTFTTNEAQNPSDLLCNTPSISSSIAFGSLIDSPSVTSAFLTLVSTSLLSPVLSIVDWAPHRDASRYSTFTSLRLVMRSLVFGTACAVHLSPSMIYAPSTFEHLSTASTTR